MPKLLIFDAFTLLICKKNVAIYALLRCKIFSLKIWLCEIFDKFHVWQKAQSFALSQFLSVCVQKVQLVLPAVEILGQNHRLQNK